MFSSHKRIKLGINNQKKFGEIYKYVEFKHTFLNIHWVKEEIRRVNLKYFEMRDFPGGAVVKNPPANAGDMGSSPGPGRSHMPWSN